MAPRTLGLPAFALALVLTACSTAARPPAPSSETIVIPPASSAPPAAAASDVAPPPAPAPSPAPPEGAPDLREAALRPMFAKNASGQQQRARVFCIQLEHESDPTPSFLARFGDVKIPVRPASACTQSADQGVVDKTTKARGLAFRVDAVRRIDADHAEVDGGYYEAGLSASGNTYTLERKNGRWVVTKDVMHWIS